MADTLRRERGRGRGSPDPERFLPITGKSRKKKETHSKPFVSEAKKGKKKKKKKLLFPT